MLLGVSTVSRFNVGRSRLFPSGDLSGPSQGHVEWPVTTYVVRFATDRERHRLTCFQRCLKRFMDAVYLEFEQAAMPLHAKGKTAPTRRKLRVNGYPVTPYRQSRKAKDGDHPDPAQRGDMYAAVDRHMRVGKIDRRSLVEETQGEVGVAQPGGGKPMHGAAQRTAMAASRRVVLEIALARPVNEFIGQQSQQCHDVGLLDYLGLCDPLPPQHDIHRHGAAGVFCKIDLLKRREAFELFEQAGFRMEASRHGVRNLPPRLEFGIFQVESGRNSFPAIRPARLQQGRHIKRAPDVPPSHDIGEGVVVDVLMILVGSDHAADMAVTVGLRLNATGPEPARLEQDLRAGVAKERFISGGLPVLPDGVGDVGTDVLLLLSAENIDDQTVRADRVFGRDFRTVTGRLPGIECAAPTQAGGLGARRIESMKAVHEQRPGRLGPSQRIEWNQEDFRVPKHVATIVVSGECPRGYRDAFVSRVGRAVEVIGSEPQRLLRRLIAVNLHVAAVPAAFPGSLMIRDDAAPASLSRGLKLASR